MSWLTKVVPISCALTFSVIRPLLARIGWFFFLEQDMVFFSFSLFFDQFLSLGGDVLRFFKRSPLVQNGPVGVRMAPLNPLLFFFVRGSVLFPDTAVLFFLFFFQTSFPARTGG